MTLLCQQHSFYRQSRGSTFKAHWTSHTAHRGLALSPSTVISAISLVYHNTGFPFCSSRTASQLEIAASGRNGVLMASSEHISTWNSSAIFMSRVHLPCFRISAKAPCSLAAILAWCPKEKRPQRLPCLSVSVLFSPFLDNSLRASVLQSETGCGKECPSVSSFSCSKIIY